MKKMLFVLVVLIISFSLNSGCDSNNQKTSLQSRLDQLKSEVYSNITLNLLPYWSAKMLDDVNGGFYGRMDSQEKLYPDEDKGGIMNARILWTYSSAYRVIKDTSYLRLATRAKDYILAHFIDKEFGGAYRSLTAFGEPSDTRKQTYTQSFFIYALSEYNRATGDTVALRAAKEIFELFEKHALDKESNGYFEVFTIILHIHQDKRDLNSVLLDR